MSQSLSPRRFPPNFLWGAASAAHQVEGNNVNSNWWHREQQRPIERSGDSVDHYHRYREDMALLRDAGLNTYRFSIEWARVEPAPGHISRAMLAHYRRMIDTALELELTPVVVLHHFTSPQWFAAEGGWRSPEAVDRFTGYVEAVAPILGDVEWLGTINEPNILALFEGTRRRPEDRSVPVAHSMVTPDEEIGRVLVDAHHRAREVLRERTDAKLGWTVALQAFVARPGCEALQRQLSHEWEGVYLEAAQEDDFIGVQSYTSQDVDENGVVAHPEHPDNTLNGWAYRPDALGIALRDAWRGGSGVPLLVTEHGISLDDDARRIQFVSDALGHLSDAMAEGIDVHGYLYWSALDSYEWGTWRPTFGLIGADRETFVRTPKPSLTWLGGVARRNGL